MGKKKVNKQDIKNSQKQLIIWTVGICLFVLLIVIGIMYNSQGKNRNKANSTSDSAKTEQKTNTASDDSTTQQTQSAQTPQQVDMQGKSLVEIETTKGKIEVVLENEKMPITVTNFLKLVNQNFYNGLTFHRVEDWVIQGGDPKGDGTGGSNETIKLETSPDLKNVRGAIAMARSTAPNSASSQFYILKKDMTGLDGQYAVFGSVLAGMEIVDKIEIGDKMLSIKVLK